MAADEQDDALNRALREAPGPGSPHALAGIVEVTRPRAQPVGDVLDALREEAVQAVAGQFFDEGVRTEAVPIIKRARAEAGSVRVDARRHTPPLAASVAIDVRCERDGTDAGVYQIRAQGRLARENEGARVERDFSVPIEVRDDGPGGLQIDPDAVRHEIASAIRLTGGCNHAAEAPSVSPTR